MRVAIMQPYFWPYLGYFQLLACADLFVIYDDIKYTKKGWINRNRILVNGQDQFLTLPLKSDSDHLHIGERRLVDTFGTEASRIMRRLEGAYRHAAFLYPTLELAERCLRFPDYNLFQFLLHSVSKVAEHLNIVTPIVISSSLGLDPELRGQERVLAICESLAASEYVNLPGGKDIYVASAFARKHIRLRFLDPEPSPYSQGSGTAFISNLSIIDLLMWIGPGGANAQLAQYGLVE